MGHRAWVQVGDSFPAGHFPVPSPDLHRLALARAGPSSCLSVAHHGSLGISGIQRVSLVSQ